MAGMTIGAKQARWPPHTSSADPQLNPYAAIPHPFSSMPTWPTPSGRRTVTIELPEGHVAFLDSQAKYQGCSRAAYIRQLIRRDIELQSATATA